MSIFLCKLFLEEGDGVLFFLILFPGYLAFYQYFLEEEMALTLILVFLLTVTISGMLSLNSSSESIGIK